MARVASNLLIDGLSGMLGKSLVFKNLRGKTIVTHAPAAPKRQSDQQKINRGKFREASMWAKEVLLDPQAKAYYQLKARKLKLPNAYTAAITDFMRKPKASVMTSGSVTTYAISKKDFDLKKAELVQMNDSGQIERTAGKESGGTWIVNVPENAGAGASIRVTDASGYETVIGLDG
jgi:hypothetical protein